MRRGIRKLLKFRGAIAGVAAIEFALLLPMLLTAVLGTFELSRMSAIARKITLTTSTALDLTTQNTALTSAELNVILSASAQIFAPYSTSGLTMVISELAISASGVATVAWSQAYNGTALPVGQVEPITSLIAQPSSYIVWCSITYTYTPIVSTMFGLTKIMTDQLYMAPRNSKSIPLTNS